ncbi:GGDEF domain-containing protein [Sulfitobacter sabulilitoris]|uniref:GGDEF domain-containing protein n=2 Tax=Sulfitobacter sabulilitoris TaxID=2562655 RepID=A0A5S3PML8_9RHOB|nr:GGDEF domain-containing protein [Sulfitobacter sabulilitoris]TMM55633.1 GGDEF domain-containing protein [Sulfitobacter sabulilitoris]
MEPTSFDMLDVLCPMHLVLSDAGRVVHVGPTLRKLRPEQALVDRGFLDIFAVKRPRAIGSVAELCAVAGAKLHVNFRDSPQTELKGVLVPGPGRAQTIVNLSFGISILDGVRDYALSAADFAATDLTIEMLYLVEAKSAAMEASRNLNKRLQIARVAAEEQAFTDTLTGVKNRRAVNHVLSGLIASRAQFALMQIDLDFFKAVNDTLGHAAGDHVLQTVARIMVEETRGHDTVARVGGDEFVILLEAIQDRATVERIGRRIIDRLQQPIAYRDQTCVIAGSIGTVLSHTYEEPDADQILADADIALYASKHAGRARQTFFRPELRDAADVRVAPFPDPATVSRLA